jgi:hypothetical protein
MLKAQQQTISELRAELKQARDERHAADTSQRREIKTTARQAGREAAREAMASTVAAEAHAMVTKGPTVPLARGAYISVFGGWGHGGGSHLSQLGTAFFTEAEGGPLSVNASGRTGNGGVWFGGAHAGYEWAYGSNLLPAIEIEGLYLARSQQRATLQNPTARLAEHTFDDTFPASTAVLLANVVVGFRTPYQNVTPYIGGGMGAARIDVSGATSSQVSPAEAGVNHFNSDPDSAAWTFAAQAKAGVRVALGNSRAYVFGEYRYLYVGSADQVFGSTVAPGHVETSPWTARFGDTSYQMAVGGIGTSF